MKKLVYWLYARIFARKVFRKLNLLLFHLSLRGLGILNYRSDKISGELFLSKYLKSHFSLNTIFDVGANQGDYAATFKDVNNCVIYCFEPHPKTFEALSNRFLSNKNILSISKGLSNKPSKAKIYDHAQNDGSEHASIFEEVITGVHGTKSVAIDIQLSTLDEEIAEHKVKRINLLKIDTEGNELNVLKGGTSAIEKGIIDVIQLEFNSMNVISRSFMKDFIDLLPGYNFYRLLPNDFLPINYSKNSSIQYEIFAFQNIVAIRKELDNIKS